MKNFNNLLSEIKHSESLEELESGADLFQYGLDKEYYTLSQVKQFTDTYWIKKNKFIAQEMSSSIKDIGYMQLLSIITGANSLIKNDREQLIQYINSRIKAIKNVKRLA